MPLKESFLQKRLFSVPFALLPALPTVTDLINRIVQVLRGDLYWVRISARDVELIKPVEL